MPALFVSGLVVLVIELGLFGLLWIQDPTINLLVVISHVLTAVLASYWFSSRWSTFFASKQMVLFIISLIALLPIVGSIILLLIDNRSLLREYGIKEGLGSEELQTDSPKDLLNYFSAPDQYSDRKNRNTRGLLSSLDDEAYLGLLIASRHLSDKEAYALLSDALFSPFESARLMAYSLRGKLEDKITNSKQEKLASLDSASTSKQKLELHLAVALDCLHIIDVGIESADRDDLIEQAKHHCIQVLRLDSRSIRGYRTLGKILRLQGYTYRAQKAEQHAFSLAST